jgi:hypothetical protein
MHGKANLLKPLIANLHAALQHVKAAAEQLRAADPWAILLRYVSDKIAPISRTAQNPCRPSSVGVTAGFRFNGFVVGGSAQRQGWNLTWMNLAWR